MEWILIAFYILIVIVSITIVIGFMVDDFANGIIALIVVSFIHLLIWFVGVAMSQSEYENDPTNPRKAAQLCIDRGGIPSFKWTGAYDKCELEEK